MQRIPEPELMDEDEQARAYAMADFEEPHTRFVELLGETFPRRTIKGYVLDLGCGPADVTLRFAKAYPECHIDGVDGAQSMLKYGHEAIARQHLGERVQLIKGYLPGANLPLEQYDVVISNSLLHHLQDPMVLWDTVNNRAKPGAAIFIMDLLRPQNRAQVRALVDQYAAGEPEVLRQDFYNSLLAAYRPEELQDQLHRAGLDYLDVQVISDRHLTVTGILGDPEIER